MLIPVWGVIVGTYRWTYSTALVCTTCSTQFSPPPLGGAMSSESGWAVLRQRYVCATRHRHETTTFFACERQNMLGPEDADDEETKAEILEEFGTYGTVLQVRWCHLLTA